MQQVIILRALPWGRDSRVERWAKIYKTYRPFFGVWGESDSSKSVESITAFKRTPSNKLSIGLGYLWFSFKSFYFVLKYAKKNDVVVFIDLETILIAWVAAVIKGAKIHYDMADPFYLAKPIPGKQFWKFIETLFVKKIFRVTAPHISRFDIFTKIITPNMSIIENVPFFTDTPPNAVAKTDMEYINLGYFGGLEADVRGLENITKLVMEDKRLRFIVAGIGHLEEYFTNASKECDRINYLGTFAPDDLPRMVHDVDVYIAYYSPAKFLHTIAAPNKYYEHLFLGIPILTSCVTPQAQEVLTNGTGWCIKNDVDALTTWKNSLFNTKIDWMAYKNQCQAIWGEKYANYYTENQMD